MQLVLGLLSMFGQESGSGPDLAEAVRWYGLAAPVIVGLVIALRKVIKERDEWITRSLAQTEQIIPLAVELKDLARKLADREAAPP